MKVLIVGPAHQGKTKYAQETYGAPPLSAEWLAADGSVLRLHRWVEALMRRGLPPGKQVLAALSPWEDWCVVCDEVGSGVVPVDAFQRRWREEVGELCQSLAARADVVEWVFCGIPHRIKG